MPVKDQKNQGVDPAHVAAYESFDGCKKPCTQFGSGNARTAPEAASQIVKLGIDTSMCLEGLDGVPCPYGVERRQVIAALATLVRAG